MGLFNQLNKRRKRDLFIMSDTANLKEPELVYLTYCSQEASSLRRWTEDTNKGFITNGEEIISVFNADLMIIVDAIKQKKGESELSLKINDRIVQSYKEKNKTKLKLIRVSYSGPVNEDDIITVNGNGVENIQITIYGNVRCVL